MFFPFRLKPDVLRIKRGLEFELWTFKSKLVALLQTLVDDDRELSLLLRDTRDPPWEKPSFEAKLQRKLGLSDYCTIHSSKELSRVLESSL